MRIAPVFPIALAAALAPALPGFAQSVGLNIRPGLWEMTSTGQVSGGAAPQIPASVLAQMTPQQRAQMAAMAGSVQNILAQPMVIQMCITAADLQRGFSADPNVDATNCTHKLLTNTANVAEIELTCTGDHPATGKIHYEATSATTVTGSMNMATTMGGSPMSFARTIDGKWLADDCGDVKPIGQQ